MVAKHNRGCYITNNCTGMKPGFGGKETKTPSAFQSGRIPYLEDPYNIKKNECSTHIHKHNDICPMPTHATTASKKYHFRDYYKRYRICKKCGEYVSTADVCPACGSTEMAIEIADIHAYSNPKRCKNCSYESWGHFSYCPKCGGEMDYIHSYIVGDFTSLGEHRPDVEACSEDEDILELPESRICFNALPEMPQRVNLICNYYDWYVRNTTKWINASNSWKKDYFEITVQPNLEKEDRTAVLEVICGNKIETVTVSQYGLSFRRISTVKELLAYLKSLIGIIN